ncbi:hypothetical protein [Planococcus shixiaomingii]|uniref:hypothetical protein n=1 Tax=Planococcus shixiaomingii TaxID=3058393 RepID=UPI002614F43B|nr:hypothetical protein [Planococcus sp. N022]WKA56812.1 hypothetical protein QWY21_19525 [Planococcus sp. N022]
MSEIKDPMQTILEGLNAPVEALKPTEFDNEAIHRYLMVKYANPNLQDELLKE